MIKTQWMNWEAKCRERTTRTSKMRNFHRDCKLSQWQLTISLTLRSLYDVSQSVFTKHCLDLERLWPAFTRSPTQLTQICPGGWSRQVILHTVVIFILSSTICVKCVQSVWYFTLSIKFLFNYLYPKICIGIHPDFLFWTSLALNIPLSALTTSRCVEDLQKHLHTHLSCLLIKCPFNLKTKARSVK